MNMQKVRKIVKNALEEDLGTGDITTENVIERDETSKAEIFFKEEGVLAGLPVAKLVFKELDDGIEFSILKDEGETVKIGEKVAEISGRTRSILKGERLALNFLQRLSGIATNTRSYVKKIEGTGARVVDTRKTTPNLRILEKYAVRVGGGTNHRMGLYDAVLIKDNHIRSTGGVKEAIMKVETGHTVKIEVEIESIDDIEEALEAGADIIMLDNMEAVEMKEAVEIIGDRAITEASGGITLENIREVAETGVDMISVGALTHQIRSIDISLDLTEQ